MGVLEKENEKELRASHFTQTKPKTNQYFFLSDFRNLNKQLKNNHI